MKRFLVQFLAGAFLLSACSSATGIEIDKAWARPAMQSGNGAVYFLLQNHSAGADELTGISSEVADAVEMHESIQDGDVMRMQQVMTVPIPGKASVEFSPGGLHVMLIGLKQALKTGDEFQITLQFANHEDMTITVPVQEMESQDSMNGH